MTVAASASRLRSKENPRIFEVSAANSTREIRRALKASDGGMVSIEIQRSGQVQDKRLRLKKIL
jgi:hypothetical protein